MHVCVKKSVFALYSVLRFNYDLTPNRKQPVGRKGEQPE